jgi:hypothetical protein
VRPAGRAGVAGAISGARVKRHDQDNRPMSVVRTLTAENAAELREISGWLHDGAVDIDSLSLDTNASTARLHVDQQAFHNEQGLPRRELLRRTPFFSDFRQPWIRLYLTVRNAVDTTTEQPLDEPPPEALGLDYNPSHRRLRLWLSLGGYLDVTVTALLVALDVTDEIAFMRRHRYYVGRLESIGPPQPPP